MENYLGHSNFDSLQSALELEVYFNMSDIGPLYFTHSDRSILVKHFEKAPGAIKEWIQSYNQVIQFVRNSNKLNSIIEMNDLLGVGEDYFVYKNMKPLPSLSDIEDAEEHYPLAMKTLKNINLGSSVEEKILKDTFENSKDSVLWSENDEKFYLADLKITI